MRDVRKKKLRLSKKGYFVFGTCGLVIVFAIGGMIVVPDETYVPEEAIESTGESESHAAAVVQQIYNPIMIGDSVPAAINLSAMYMGSLNDSVVSRWTHQGASVLQEYANMGAVGDIVIVACFSNHPLQPGDLDNIYNIVGEDRQLFFINSCTPYDLTTINNAQLQDFASEHDNIHIID